MILEEDLEIDWSDIVSMSRQVFGELNGEDMYLSIFYCSIPLFSSSLRSKYSRLALSWHYIVVELLRAL